MSYLNLSPSAASRWITCPGSVALCKDIPQTTSVYAEEGKRAHEYAAWLLTGAKAPEPFTPTREMVDYVAVYTNAIRRAAEGKILLVEQYVDVSAWTRKPEGRGFIDALIVDGDTIEVHDLKYGMGHLVDADNNEQLMIYALSAIPYVEGIISPEVKNFKLVIHQPRRDHISEWTVSLAELAAFGVEAQEAGSMALEMYEGRADPFLNPSDKACLWCPAKATCPALVAEVQRAVFDDFACIETDVNTMGAYPAPDTLSLVESWLRAIEGAIYEKLQRFEPVAGWKLVEGRKGNRAWTDAQAVEELAKQSRLKRSDSHESKLKSPAQLEKVLSDKKWAAFQGLITRGEAKPMMVAESDKRPALVQAKAEDFDVFS